MNRSSKMSEQGLDGKPQIVVEEHKKDELSEANYEWEPDSVQSWRSGHMEDHQFERDSVSGLGGLFDEPGNRSVASFGGAVEDLLAAEDEFRAQLQEETQRKIAEFRRKMTSGSRVPSRAQSISG